MKKERRRAVHCDIVEPSKTSPGYFKYLITIREIDGSEHKVPAYGKDMQDAIERLLWSERIEKVNDKTIYIIILTLFLFSIVIGGILSFINSFGTNNTTWEMIAWACAGMFALSGFAQIVELEKKLKNYEDDIPG